MVGGQRHNPAALTLDKRQGTRCTGCWLGSRNGLDGYGKPLPHRDLMDRRAHSQ